MIATQASILVIHITVNLYLHAQKEVVALPPPEPILPVLLASLVNLFELLRRAKVRVELPRPPADEVVGRHHPWAATLTDLQLPHGAGGQHLQVLDVR